MVNGVGDVVSSGLVGMLWAAFPASPAAGFFAAAALQLTGTLVLRVATGSAEPRPGGGSS